mmetsp:Transcript_46939/g.74705  ORF Transcript_46939/g.74705 Transcript_46939/m.74705 type:complete len:228 (+) Transcript_46939:1331-2014(+)
MPQEVGFLLGQLVQLCLLRHRLPLEGQRHLQGRTLAALSHWRSADCEAFGCASGQSWRHPLGGAGRSTRGTHQEASHHEWRDVPAGCGLLRCRLRAAHRCYGREGISRLWGRLVVVTSCLRSSNRQRLADGRCQNAWGQGVPRYLDRTGILPSCEDVGWNGGEYCRCPILHLRNTKRMVSGWRSGEWCLHHASHQCHCAPHRAVPRFGLQNPRKHSWQVGGQATVLQ